MEVWELLGVGDGQARGMGQISQEHKRSGGLSPVAFQQLEVWQRRPKGSRTSKGWPRNWRRCLLKQGGVFCWEPESGEFTSEGADHCRWAAWCVWSAFAGGS